jgi:hypothetical protein
MRIGVEGKADGTPRRPKERLDAVRVDLVDRQAIKGAER